MVGRLTPILAALSLLAATGAAAAPFADPTQPPQSSAGEGTGVAQTGPRLESVLISPYRRLAVISGREVRIGETFGEGRVVSITPTEVAIRRGNATEVLRLFPELEKRPAKRTK